MKYVPFVAQVDSWKKAFSSDSKTSHHGNRSRWLVNQTGEGQNEPAIQLVTPTQQAVERAQSEIQEMRNRGSPIPKYTPKVAKKKGKRKKTKGKPKKITKFKGLKKNNFFLNNISIRI